MLRAHGFTDKGRIRPINEDCWVFDREQNLCVVADGMGGHKAGEVAARIAVAAVVDFLASDTARVASWPFGYDRSLSYAGNRLRTAIHLAHVQVFQAAAASKQYSGMGTTIVAATVDGNRLSAGSVGDSRLYLIAGDRLRQLTRDDSWVGSVLAEDPDANLAYLDRHPMRNALTNAVGASRRANVRVVEEMLSGGELLLLSTDGVHGELDDGRIERLMLDSGGLEAAAANLVGAALARGSRDNCTAVVARYERDSPLAAC